MPIPNAGAAAFLAQRRSRSAKLFTAPVPAADALAAILTSALRVPDHGKLEPWRLVVIEKPAMARLAALAEARAIAMGGDAEKIGKGRGQFDLGQLAVAVIASPKPSEKVPEIEQLLSAAALCVGIVNAAEAAGWGACWLTGWPAHDRGFVQAAFDCTDAERLAGIVHIATAPTDGPDRPRPDLARLISWAPQ